MTSRAFAWISINARFLSGLTARTRLGGSRCNFSPGECSTACGSALNGCLCIALQRRSATQQTRNKPEQVKQARHIIWIIQDL